MILPIALGVLGLLVGIALGFIASLRRGGELAFEYADMRAAAQHTDTDEQQRAQEHADLGAVLAVIEARDILAAYPAGLDGGNLRDRIRAVHQAVDDLRERFAARLMETGRFPVDKADDKQPTETTTAKVGA